LAASSTFLFSSSSDILSESFDEVVNVDAIDSGDAVNLQLLERPDLGVTFTKLHCWRLTRFQKCVFLDADTLVSGGEKLGVNSSHSYPFFLDQVLRNCDELFDREELSAAPDAGWPDCFNSGVFVFEPSEETYDKLIQHVQTQVG